MNTFRDVLDFRERLFGFAKDENIEGVEGLYYKSSENFRIANSCFFTPEHLFLLNFKSFEYAQGVAERYVSRRIFERELARDIDDWHYKK